MLKSVEVDGNHYVITCKSESNRSGFYHKAILHRNMNELISEKIQYYNRTWESYQFETVIKSLIEKALKKGIITDEIAEAFSGVI